MWTERNSWAVGGLLEIGYQPETDIIFVLSSQGRGIFDVITDQKIDRDYSDYYIEKWDHTTGIVEGFGAFEKEKIICGGFEYPNPLKQTTEDGWKIILEKEERPDYHHKLKIAEVLYLENPLLSKKTEITFSHYGFDRAYGFSDTGRSFVHSCSSDITFWSR